MGLTEQFVTLQNFANDLGDLKREIAAETRTKANFDLWCVYDKKVDALADHLIAMNDAADLGAALRGDCGS